ncbi:caspase family protein [Actinokineospora enzanensis]|uniref:caspase family protein n=1 Tax=Actinokineospora enzanensis TaxID=155975 RepID=UPI0003A8A6CB|nr:caspase family protein [Actinokineospora enzanensis]
MTGVPDPARSRAVLVGVSEYVNQARLPSVVNNVRELRRVFSNADLWGLPDEHCVALVDPESTAQVLDAVHAAAEAASDLLVFYFAGHGLLDDRGDLYLALPDADKDRLYRAVRFDDVRREIVGAPRVLGKVVILDCCFSGRAMQGGMSGSDDLADRASVEGSYVMTACGETKLALAPPGEKFTAFTGALLHRMRHGIPNGPKTLDMETLFRHVRADLRAKHRPVPQQRIRNDGSLIALVRNRSVPRVAVKDRSGAGVVRRRDGGRDAATAQAAAKPVVRPPERARPPSEFPDLYRWSPSELVARVDEQRSAGAGAVADRLLRMAARRRPDQEVAAIVDLLRRTARHTELRAVHAAAATRPRVEILRIVDVLRETNQADEASALLRAAGATDAANIARLARRLRDQQRHADLAALLDAAMDTARKRSALLGLVNTLFDAGLREEGDQLVLRAMNTLPGPAVIEFADELRVAGRDKSACTLYAAAADTLVATRPVAAVTRLCAVMSEGGHARGADRVAAALIATVDGMDRAVEVAREFWNVTRPDDAQRALDSSPTRLPISRTLALAAELRSSRHDQTAYDLCLHTVLDRPHSTMEIVTALREAGRPVDADTLLRAAVLRLPVRAVADLVAEHADHVLDSAVRRPPREVAELLDTLRTSNPAVAARLGTLMADMMTERAEFIPILIERADPRRRREILTRISSTTDGWRAVGTLREGDLRVYLDTVLAAAAMSAQPDRVIATTVASLSDVAPPPVVTDLLTRAMDGRDLKAAKRLIAAIRELNHPRALDAVVTWVRDTTSGESRITYALLRLGLREYVGG